MKWTAESIASQEGKLALVTGANSGLGYHTALELARKKAKVVMACRNMEKGERALASILSELPDARVELCELDLASLSFVDRFAKEFISKNRRLDILVNNAGLMAIPYTTTEDGLEMQFGVNHIGHFALSARLFPLLRHTAGSRIVTVSSSAYRIGRMRFEDIFWLKAYRKWQAYGMSKLANLMFTFELAAMVEQAGLDTKIIAAHPGYTDSNILEKGPAMKDRKFVLRLVHLANRIAAQKTEIGVLSQLYAATAPEARNGAFYGPDGVLRLRGYPEEMPAKSAFFCKEYQGKLWKLSEKLSGVLFPVN